jgi:hypothetical protein
MPPHHQVRKLLNERREPSWSFTTLYLVKDSFALMLEGAGLWEDAFQVGQYEAVDRLGDGARLVRFLGFCALFC